jgi:hypothetical protein
MRQRRINCIVQEIEIEEITKRKTNDKLLYGGDEVRRLRIELVNKFFYEGCIN